MKKSLTSTIEYVGAGILFSILIMVFVGQSLEITGDSMYPTLKNRERIIVEKVSYKSREPERGEIVVIRSLQNESVFLIKRVIAVPGDTIGLSGGKVIINGSVLDESHLPKGTDTTRLGELSLYTTSPIPEGNYAVMGDNRGNSFDSRMFGLVPVEKFVGKAFVVYWPPSEIKKI